MISFQSNEKPHVLPHLLVITKLKIIHANAMDFFMAWTMQHFFTSQLTLFTHESRLKTIWYCSFWKHFNRIWSHIAAQPIEASACKRFMHLIVRNYAVDFDSAVWFFFRRIQMQNSAWKSARNSVEGNQLNISAYYLIYVNAIRCFFPVGHETSAKVRCLPWSFMAQSQQCIFSLFFDLTFICFK